MADLNALIAQGVQFKAPTDPFAQYAQMQAMQQGQQTNQLNQMKMQEYQRGMEETNAMRRLDPSSPTYIADITRISPEKGFAFAKLQQEGKTAKTEGQSKDVKLIADKLALLPEAYRMADTPEAYLALHKSVHADPVLGPYLQSVGATPEKGMATLQNAVQAGKFNELRMGSMQSVSQLMESMKPQVVGAGSSVYNPQTGTFTQSPRADQLKTPAELAQAIQLAQAGRAPGATVAKAPAGYRVTATGDLEAIPGGPAAKFAELKQVPVHAQKAIVGASTAISKIDNAIAALESGTEEATGMKGYLPDMALNRMYPKGTEARAAVADIGSLVMHERSGAAVTASESPRLKPFIPLITDDKATALKKLKRMRQIQADDAEALAGTYNPEQGFREFKTPGGKAATPAASGGVDSSNPLLR